MDGVTITGNVQTVASSGSTTPAVSITSSVEPGVTLQGTLTTGGVGPTGATGAAGADGEGVPVGGTTGQVLNKNSGTDFDTAWATLTKSSVGLSNVDNTSDASKPISTLTQTALDAKADDSAVVHDTGTETIAGVKTFSSDPIIPDEVYGAGWNGSLEPPTKNAVYDKIETISAGSGITEALAIAYSVAL